MPFLNPHAPYIDISISWSDRLLMYLSNCELPPKEIPLRLGLVEIHDDGRLLYHQYDLDFKSLFDMDINSIKAVLDTLKWYNNHAESYQFLSRQKSLVMVFLKKLSPFGFISQEPEDFLYHFQIALKGDELVIFKAHDNPYARELRGAYAATD